jgi:hypothetical protein
MSTPPTSPRHPNRLELELDDWLDPSLPPSYHSTTPYTPHDTYPPIANDFTTDPEFVHTTAHPPYLPPYMRPDGRIVLIPVFGTLARFYVESHQWAAEPMDRYME